MKPWKLQYSNYRPVSLLSNSCIHFQFRFWQKHLTIGALIYLTLSWRRPLSYRNQSIDLLCKSMDWFLYHNGLRYERVNTEMNIYSYSEKFIHKIRNEIDKWNYACETFEDFQKAFNSVDHHILFNTFEYYSVRGIPNIRCTSYLSNRKRFVWLNVCKFEYSDFKYRFPQGSILGSLLFYIYNNLHLAIF